MADIVILMGPSGSGKSIQGKRLAADYGWVHLSSGELLRRDTAMAAQLASGSLTPSEDVERIIEAAIRGVDHESTIVLDGFPRLIDETEWLESRLTNWQRHISNVILIDVPLDVIHTRLSLRGRIDDAPDALALKLKEYIDETKPVLAYFKHQGLLHRIDGAGAEEEVYSRITKVFNV